MRRVVAFLALVLLSALASAQSSDIPVSNWTVPPYTAASGGITTMADVTSPRAFIGVQPCRLVDTRSGAFPEGFGPPNLSPGVTRVFDLINGPCPAMPNIVDAYSLNVTVVTPSGPGHLVIWPTGASEPSVSSINFSAGQTIANAVIVPAGNSVPIGAISVKAGVSGTHLLIDINGYFSSQPVSTSATFAVQNNSPSFVTANFFNSSSFCTGPCALSATSSTTSSGRAISGNVPTGTGNSAGVFGKHVGGFPVPAYTGAGVRGESNLVGVLGLAGGTSSLRQAVAGGLLDNSGNELVWGALGSVPGIDSPATSPWGVFAGGNMGASGTKSFVEPHPTDAGLTITYVSLEGPEAGTYFRGRGKFQNGIARIAVPEHFRLVTDPDGLTVQVTPIGPMATVSVVRADLNEIVVQASRNVEFYYTVNGVRAAFKDLNPIRHSGEFMPRTADAKIPMWLSPVQKRLLIQNGTYREDGSVNAETARRLGWDRIWADRDPPQPVAAPD